MQRYHPYISFIHLEVYTRVTLPELPHSFSVDEESGDGEARPEQEESFAKFTMDR